MAAGKGRTLAPPRLRRAARPLGARAALLVAFLADTPGRLALGRRWLAANLDADRPGAGGDGRGDYAVDNSQRDRDEGAHNDLHERRRRSLHWPLLRRVWSDRKSTR